MPRHGRTSGQVGRLLLCPAWPLMRAVVAVLALVTCVHAGLWGLLRDQRSAADFNSMLPSVSYNPFPPADKVPVDYATAPQKIRNDLREIAKISKAIRLYSSTGGSELVPPIANEFGLKVYVGAWLDSAEKDLKFADRNKAEIAAAIQLTRANRNVIGVFVGNETILRAGTGLDAGGALNAAGDTRPKADDKRYVTELIGFIKQVKRQVEVPVTTGEIWDTWRDNPELASAVDFISPHMLPYWSNRHSDTAVDFAFQHYNELREQFPGKRILIAEFGWPSAGYNRLNGNPGRLEQAQVIRDFVSRAERLGVDYNIIEGTDQPWKYNEGSIGSYWGILNASLEPKFAFTGPVVLQSYWKLAGIALLIGVLFSLPILRLVRPTVLQAALLATAAHAVGAWFATVFDYWNTHYFVFGSAFALGLGLLLLIPLVFIAMARVEEVATIAFGRGPVRLIRSPILPPGDAPAPKVSIHVPAYFEPPDMLMQTLNAVARLDYPNFECVVIINNTPDPAFYEPIEAHCATLGERFKFINAQKIEGFKAGALRLAMEATAPDAEIIGIIDADYVVTPDWLKDLVPAFADPRVGLVQAPQDHRDHDRSLMHHVMNGEYAGFFDIGMVERNESNAIIVHGTMCLIRRAAMDAAGGWSSDTICEDSDLGLAIIEHGWLTHYTNRRYGHGLLPDTFEAFKKQRHRWAYGGFQIIKKHWRRFLPGGSRLTPEQRRDFALGWLNWLGAESLGVVVALLNLLWVPVVAFAGIAIPDKILTLPIMAAFVISLMHFLVLYRLRVPVRIGQLFGAMIAAMSVQLTVARAVGNGLIKDHLPFARTSKGGLSLVSVEFQAFWEAVIAALLLIGATVLVMTNHEKIVEIDIFAAVLVLQSLPFLSAVALAVLENLRLNDFAFWRNLRTRTGELVGWRPVTVDGAGQLPVKAD